MDPDEIINTSVNSSNGNNIKESSTKAATNNEQQEKSTVRKTKSFTRKRRGTQSNGDDSNGSSTKQTITTAINQILNRRPSISSQRPKDLIAEINVNKLDTNNSTQKTSPPSPVTVNAPFQQSQNRPLHSHLTQHQQPPFQRLLRKKSLRASTAGQHSPISSSQASPLSPTVEEEPSYNEINNNLNNINNSSNNINNNSNSNIINKRIVTTTTNSSNNSIASPVSSPRKQFPFEIGSREQKLLLSQTKDDRMEKLLKKAKVFLDRKQRLKSRATSLWSFTDAANELDQAQFFQQNSEDVFHVIYNSFMAQVDKIKQKPDRPMSFTSKESLNLNKTLLLLRKIFLFLPDRVRGGWQRKQIAELLSVLLDHGNHSRVRIQGFQLLLLWMNDQATELDECIYLYSNAISLNLFLYDQTRNDERMYHTKDNVWRKSYVPVLDQELIRGDHRGPIFPSPNLPTFNDAINLIQIDLGSVVRLAHVAAGSIPPSENYEFPAIESIEPDNGIAVGMGIDAALASAKHHFELIKKQYFVKLFPQCAKHLGLLSEDKEYGFQKCPPAILRALITFFIHHCLDNYSASDTISSYPSPATPILKSIVLGPENREFAHEIVRQSLMLPAGSPLYKDIVRGAVHIVGVWVLSGEEERPAFLRKSLNSPLSPLSTSQSDASTTPNSDTSFTSSYSDANVYLRRYIELLNLVFEDHSSLTADGGMTNIEVESQTSIYRNVLSLFRSIMAEGSIELELGTWETLLSSLLEIQKRVMNQNDKYALIPSIALADELADYLTETLLYTFARSRIQDQDLWNKLTIHLSFSARWSQAISQWAKIMLRLTKILSKHVHQVDLNQIELQRRLLELSISERHNHHRRKPSKHRAKHFTLKHKSSGSTSSREDFDISSPSPSKNTNEHGKFGRRTLSIHSDTNQSDTKLLGIGPASSSMHSGSVASDEDDNEDEEDDFFDVRSDTGNEDTSDLKSNRTSAASVFFTQPNFSNEKLSISLANFRSPDFIHLDVLPWTAESSSLVWKNMLYALGNLNHIQIIPYHADAIKCLVDMLDMFGAVYHNQFGNAPSPPIYEFATWLLDACDLPLAFAPGRALAYGGLCKMMSRRQYHEFDESYYPRFYRTLLKGLSGSDKSITYAIINNSTKLFSQGFPGINALYRSFIESIRNLLSEHDSKKTPGDTRKNAITILCSLICFVLSDNTCSEIRLVLKEALISSLSAEDSIRNYDTHNMLLYGICTLAFDELTATTWPDKVIIKECFRALLNHLYWSHLPVVSAAADCLITFAQNSSMWPDNEEIYVMILQDVFASLIGALDQHIVIQKTNTRNGRGFIIAKLFSCLLEWLMIIPSSIFTDTDLSQLVFDVIDLALEDCGAESPNYYKNVYPTSLKSQTKETPLRFKKSLRKITLGTHPNSEACHVFGIENDVEDENFVKESSECVLLHLTHHFDNFSPPFGPAMMNSTLTGPLGSDIKDDEYAECTERYQYFSFNDKTIITVVEMPEKNSISRLVIRDMTGRYTWDTQLFYKGYFGPLSSNLKYPEITECMTLIPSIRVEPTSSKPKLSNATSSPRSRSRNRASNFYKDKNRLPVWTENSNNEQVDMLDQLLYYVSGHTPLSETSLVSLETSTDNEFEKELDRHIQEEILYSNSMDSQASSWYENIMSLRNSMNQVTDKKSKKSKRLSRNLLYSRSTSPLSLGADFSLSKAFLPVIPPEVEKPQGPYQQCRLFLSHFGWLNPDTFKDGSIYTLNKDPALYRDIRLLDKKCSRECIKVALLYVGPGQDDEQSILYNENGSKEYEEFVTSLGWEIDLATHSGYLGGLERNSTNGTTSIYYCTSTLEMIFHDVTRMPTDSTDPKQLLKKRHIGNDHVHIIWNEHYRDYRKSTIGGDFGNAQIIISPLPTKASSQDTTLYSIDIYRDNKIPPFGPLLNGMVVAKNVLGTLVRMTAIHAFRASINLQSPATIYKHPYLQRSLDISMIIGKHKRNSKSNNSYESFISKIFFTDELSYRFFYYCYLF